MFHAIIFFSSNNIFYIVNRKDYPCCTLHYLGIVKMFKCISYNDGFRYSTIFNTLYFYNFVSQRFVLFFYIMYFMKYRFNALTFKATLWYEYTDWTFLKIVVYIKINNIIVYWYNILFLSRFIVTVWVHQWGVILSRNGDQKLISSQYC